MSILLFEAIERGDLWSVKELVDNGEDIDDYNCKDGIAPLMLASKLNRTEIVKILLDKGVWLEQRDYQGDTALSLAVSNNRIDVTKLLLDAGASTNIDNRKGQTPFYLSVRNKNVAIIKLLLEKGVSEDILNHTLYFSFLQDYDPIMVEILLRSGADINFVTVFGDSILHSVEGDMVKTVIEHGANIGEVVVDDNRGR